MFLDEAFDIIHVDEHFPPNLNIRKLAIPDLRAPEPLGCADVADQLLDGVKSLRGHSPGTTLFNSLFFFCIFCSIGLLIHESAPFSLHQNDFLQFDLNDSNGHSDGLVKRMTINADKLGNKLPPRIHQRGQYRCL